jgi:cytochrome oxidase Cu insertion factor (SCO1/SenC/PrrC family)
VPRVLIVTLDPWRDTPARLPALAQQWRLTGDDAVLSGEVAEVEAALDRWDVPRARDDASGRVDHPALVYLVDASGRIAYASRGGSTELAVLAERL